MGFHNVNDFDIEFIEKSQILIRTYKRKLSFTLLTNCLYSLVILTHEKTKNVNVPFYQQLITDIPELDSLRNMPDFVFNPVNRKGNPQPKNLKNFLGRIRHSLAHSKITPENGYNNNNEIVWKTIEFQCNSKYALNNPLELRAKFNQKQIRLFALRVSTAYQEHILGT